MEKRLDGKVVIVTGAERGLGQAYSVRIAREGARVVAAGILDMSETMNKIKEVGGEAIPVHMDVVDFETVEAMADATVKAYGSIDGLVNNAAIYGGLKFTPFEHLDEKEWDKVMAVNVKGMWHCVKAVVPQMRKQGKGKIVNISSSTIWVGQPFLLSYVASKGAVFAMTRCMAKELTGTGINVNSIMPGYTMTQASKDLETAHVPFEAVRKQVIDMQIIKRNEESEDLEGAVVFLLSDDADFITGQALTVDGGLGLH